MRNADRRHWIIAYALITVTAIALGYWFYFAGQQGLYFDARGYYDLSQLIRRDGFWNFSSELRTYGYPLFVALASLLTDGSQGMVRFVVFNLQLVIYLAACYVAARTIAPSFESRRSALALYALTALNPLLLVYTTEVLTDLLSAVLVFLAVLCAVYWPERRLKPSFVFAFGSLFIAGLAAIVRPANATIVIAVFVIWVLRALWLKDVSVRMVLAGLIGLAVPFVPQLYFNYRDFNMVQPLIVHGLYAYQMDVGTQVIKYATVVIPDRAGGLAYPNPFLPAGVTRALDFVQQSPVGYGLTVLLHAFTLFDHDFIFPYISDLQPWYRRPIALLNYLFLFTAACGVLAWLRRVWRERSITAGTLLGAALAVAIGACIAVYLLTAVENRFSLPVYLLASPFVIWGAQRLWEQSGHMRPYWSGARKIARPLIALAVCVFTFATISAWLRAQVPMLAGGSTPLQYTQVTVPPTSTAIHGLPYQIIGGELAVRFGEQIELTDYRVERPDALQGGTSVYLVLNWDCHGATTDPYEVQVRLVDAQGHVPARAVRYPDEEVAPCPAQFWEPRRERGEILALELSPALAAGEYAITVGLYDPARGTYLALNTRGLNLPSPTVTLYRMPVAKNHTSISASDLAVPERLYVDMHEIRYLGHTGMPDAVARSETLQLGLYWRARGKPQADYIAAVQLRDASGTVVLEQAARPASGTYPTLEWSVGEVLLDWHDLVIPGEMPIGEYAVVVVLREAQTGHAMGDASIGSIEIKSDN